MQTSKVFNRTNLVKFVMTAVLIALNIVLERVFTISLASNHYSLSIITIGFAAVYLGIPYAVAVAALGDILGALILPFGAYFPGFTLTNALAAFCIAWFWRKKVNLVTVSISVLLNKIICTLVLNSIWVSILYKGGIAAFPAYLVTRIPQALIMCAIEILLLALFFYDGGYIRKLIDKVWKIR